LLDGVTNDYKNKEGFDDKSSLTTINSILLSLPYFLTSLGRRWQIEGFFKTAKHRFSLHRFGQKTLLGVYRWLILSFLSYLLAYWVYLHLGNYDNLNWFHSAQQALILLFPHILAVSLLSQLKTVKPWLNELGFDFCLMRCKI